MLGLLVELLKSVELLVVDLAVVELLELLLVEWLLIEFSVELLESRRLLVVR